MYQGGPWVPAAQIGGLFPAEPDAPFEFTQNEPSPRQTKPRSRPRLGTNRTTLLAVGGFLGLVAPGIAISVAVLSSRESPGPVASHRKGEEPRNLLATTPARSSMASKAMKLAGKAFPPSVKPAEPETVQDFFDAVGFLCVRMHNVPLRSGAKIGVYFEAPGCEGRVWHQVFGEPQILPRGRERIGKVENEFDRWRHTLADGSVTVQGKIIRLNGGVQYLPTTILID